MESYFSALDPGVYDAIGIAGFGLYVLNYTLLTFRKIQTESIMYFVMNACAAGMVLVGLTNAFNLASAMIQIFWVGISIIGIVMRLRNDRGPVAKAELQY